MPTAVQTARIVAVVPSWLGCAVLARGTTLTGEVALGRSGWRLVTTMIVIAAASGGCSSGSDGGGPTGPRGVPLRVGLINLEGTPAGSATDLRLGVEAAVAYVNAELDGVNGRPLRLEVCVTSSSPEVSAQCAHDMVQKRVAAVIGGVDVGSAASLPVLTAAGIPYLGSTPLLPADFTTTGAFMFSPGGLANAASAAFATEKLEAQRVTVLRADDRPGVQLADLFVLPTLRAKGVQDKNITVVAEVPSAADLAPAVNAANRGDPDAIIVLFPPPGCARIMQAAASLGVKAPMLYIGRCGDPSVLAAGGAGANGAYFVSPVLNAEANAEDPDVQTYVRSVRAYGPPELEPTSVEAALGFATTMTVYERLKAMRPQEIDPATITAAFRSAVDEPVFMGHSYTCDGKQAIPEWVTVCNVWVRIFQFVGGRYHDASGEWTSAAASIAAR